MTASRFVLALPRRGSALPEAILSIAPSLGGLCRDVPSLWMAEDTCVTQLGSAGRAIGVLFRNDTSRRAGRHIPISGKSAAAAAAELTASYWGAYVAVLVDRDRDEHAVLADPSGHLPMYCRMTATHALISSDVRLLHQADSGGASVSWRALGDFLLRPELRQRPTCLLGVEELARGALVYPVSGDCIPVWQASEFLPAQSAPSFEEAAGTLRSAATRVIGAWADYFGPVVVAVSGGVDSSFICAAMARADKEFACVTLATTDSSGDEREYARLLARHLGVRSAERFYDPARFDPAACASAGLPRPSRRSFLTAIDTLLAEGAESLGSRIVFDGNGGDNLFCFLHSAAPVADRLRVEGPGGGVLRTFLDMCRVTGCDVGTMLKATAGRMTGGRRGGWECDRRLLAGDLEESGGIVPVTPWLDLDTGRHRGKRDHLELIMHAQYHIHGIGPGPGRFSPLMSQPLLELCLGIPTWIWVNGGRNRALARAAFADTLPASLLARTSKAGPDSFIRRAFGIHRGALRDLLLGGLLERQGLLDRAQLELAFTAAIARGDSIIYRMLDLAEAENWARSWS